MNTNPRIGIYYLLGAVALGGITFATTPWGLILLWPTISLITVALGYFRLGQRVYFKQNGQHPIGAKALHLFTLYGQELSRRAYAKQCDPWNALLPNLLIGRQLTEVEVDRLKAEGVTAVMDLTAEFSEPKALREMNYLNLPLLDLTAPSEAELDQAIQFIDTQIGDGKVYVHCKIGYSRTAAVAGSYLLHAGHARDANDAISKLQQARPSIIIRPEARATIQRYAIRCLQP